MQCVGKSYLYSCVVCEFWSWWTGWSLYPWEECTYSQACVSMTVQCSSDLCSYCVLTTLCFNYLLLSLSGSRDGGDITWKQGSAWIMVSTYLWSCSHFIPYTGTHYRMLLQVGIVGSLSRDIHVAWFTLTSPGHIRVLQKMGYTVFISPFQSSHMNSSRTSYIFSYHRNGSATWYKWLSAIKPTRPAGVSTAS